MIEIRWSVRANKDIRKIYSRLIDTNAVAAQSTIEAISLRADWLSETPFAGAAVYNSTLRSFGVLGTPYTIVYRVHGNVLSIVRIRHFAQNWRPQ